MKRYAEYQCYKNSSIKWSREIPEHWNIKKIKYLSQCNTQTLGENTDDNFRFHYIDISSVSADGEISFEEEIVFNKAPSRARRVVKANDTIVSTVRTYLKAVAFIPERNSALIASTGFAVVTPKDVYHRFLYYVLRNEGFVSEVSANSFGVSYPAITSDQLIGLKIPYPPNYAEQNQIVDFLDDKTAEIDSLIAHKQRLVQALEEQRLTIIAQAVTKGLSRAVRMKESGVGWIGETPEHWTICKVNYRYSIELGKMLDEKRIVGDSLVPYLRNQDVQWGSINSADLPEMDISETERDRYTVKSGDLLVCEGGDVGRAAIWRGNDNEVGFQKALHRVRPRIKEEDTAEFLYFVLVAAKHSGAFNENDSKATISHLTGEKFRQYRFAFPSIDEQLEIARKMADDTREINGLIEELKQSVALLHEYRQSLIFEAVTGKIDVRETVVESTVV